MIKAVNLQSAAYQMTSREKALELARREINKYVSITLSDPPQHTKFSLENEHEAWLIRCFLHNLACHRIGLIDDKLKGMGVDVEGLPQPSHPGEMP